jgi:hypothetical protein
LSAPPSGAKEDQAAWVTGREVSEEEKQEMGKALVEKKSG